MLDEIKGFTLIELVVTLLVVAILITVAAPTYRTYILKSHRADGTSTLMAMQLAQEKYRFNNTQYGTLAQVWGGVTSSPNGYYQLGISNISATGYTLTATAQGTQANDSETGTSCATLTITVNGSSVAKTPSACW